MPKILIKGLVACKGKVRGKVRIILDPSQPPKTAGGEIIVMPFSTPLMTMVLSKAAALITDCGGLTSHTAMIAREFNIPCIVGTKSATQVLKNGQTIFLNADKGIVYE